MREQLLLRGVEHAEFRETRQGAIVFSDGGFRGMPRIETRGRLRQSCNEHRLRQRQIARLFAKITLRRGFRTDAQISVLVPVQVRLKDLFLGPAAVQLPCDDRLAAFASQLRPCRCSAIFANCCVIVEPPATMRPDFKSCASAPIVA